MYTTSGAQNTYSAIFNGGNVGIGTTSPGTLLSINGIANFSTGTTTFYGGGINLAANQCYAVNGACLSSGTTYTGTYPVQVSGSAISLAFGTTTSNTWAGTQTFTNTPIFTSLTGGLVASNASTDAIYSIATSTVTN